MDPKTLVVGHLGSAVAHWILYPSRLFLYWVTLKTLDRLSASDAADREGGLESLKSTLTVSVSNVDTTRHKEQLLRVRIGHCSAGTPGERGERDGTDLLLGLMCTAAFDSLLLGL